MLFSFLQSLLHENGPRMFIKKDKLGDQMIKQLLNSVITKYRDLSVSSSHINCLPQHLASRYFAQPRPIILLIICSRHLLDPTSISAINTAEGK